MANASTHNDKHGHGDHAGHHITSIPKLFGTFLALLIFMVLTIVWAQITYMLPFYKASWFPFLNNGVALGIAVFKAVLVINIFMGVKNGSNLVKTYAILGFVWMSLMFFVFADYGTRRLEPVKGWIKESPLTMPRAPMPYENVMPERKDIKIPEREKGAKKSKEGEKP